MTQDDSSFDTTNYLTRSTVLWITVGPVLAYLAVALVFGNAVAIEVGNLTLLGAASAACVAYWPDARTALSGRRVPGWAVLCYAVWGAWGWDVIWRTVSIIWRMNGKPPAWLDALVWGLPIVGSAGMAVLHVVAPQALDGRVPARRMKRMGMTVGIVVFVAGLFLVSRIPAGY